MKKYKYIEFLGYLHFDTIKFDSINIFIIYKIYEDNFHLKRGLRMSKIQLYFISLIYYTILLLHRLIHKKFDYKILKVWKFSCFSFHLQVFISFFHPFLIFDYLYIAKPFIFTISNSSVYKIN